jgi:hypothetical protein
MNASLRASRTIRRVIVGIVVGGVIINSTARMHHSRTINSCIPRAFFRRVSGDVHERE